MRDVDIWRFPALQEVRTAWTRAEAEIDGLPTIAQLKDRGAPVDNPGMVIVGRTESGTDAINSSSFFVISSGPGHEDIVGSSLQGKTLEELIPQGQAASISKLYADICETAKLHAWRCIDAFPNALPTAYTRVIVPIRDDAGDGRCLFGVWVWHE